MSLLFNVSQFLKSDVGDSRTYDFDTDEVLDLGDARAANVRGWVRFMLTNYGVLASVRAQAELQETCARCLEGASRTVEVDYQDEYRPTIDVTSGLPSEALPSDTAFTISPNHMIDLTESLRQNFLLTIELVPLCSEDCKGLCPQCGSNRNIAPCDCESSSEDSPFSVLQALLNGASD